MVDLRSPIGGFLTARRYATIGKKRVVHVRCEQTSSNTFSLFCLPANDEGLFGGSMVREWSRGGLSHEPYICKP